tara:strand:+ start:386 stop:598 length:213 start_codon:yes stop_codon:yes gene_type:complete
MLDRFENAVNLLYLKGNFSLLFFFKKKTRSFDSRSFDFFPAWDLTGHLLNQNKNSEISETSLLGFHISSF